MQRLAEDRCTSRMVELLFFLMKLSHLLSCLHHNTLMKSCYAIGRTNDLNMYNIGVRVTYSRICKFPIHHVCFGPSRQLTFPFENGYKVLRPWFTLRKDCAHF